MRQPYEIVREKFVSPELCPPLTRERACSGNEIAAYFAVIRPAFEIIKLYFSNKRQKNSIKNDIHGQNIKVGVLIMNISYM